MQWGETMEPSAEVQNSRSFPTCGIQPLVTPKEMTCRESRVEVNKWTPVRKLNKSSRSQTFASLMNGWCDLHQAGQDLDHTSSRFLGVWSIKSSFSHSRKQCCSPEQKQYPNLSKTHFINPLRTRKKCPCLQLLLIQILLECSLTFIKRSKVDIDVTWVHMDSLKLVAENFLKGSTTFIDTSFSVYICICIYISAVKWLKCSIRLIKGLLWINLD